MGKIQGAHRRWTKAEDDALIDLRYTKSMTWPQIAEQLGRGKESCYSRYNVISPIGCREKDWPPVVDAWTAHVWFDALKMKPAPQRRYTQFKQLPLTRVAGAW